MVDRGPRALLGAAAGVLAAGMLVLFLFGTAAIPAVAGLVLLGLGLPAFVTAMQARALESAPGDTDVASAWTASAFNVGIVAAPCSAARCFRSPACAARPSRAGCWPPRRSW